MSVLKKKKLELSKILHCKGGVNKNHIDISNLKTILVELQKKVLKTLFINKIKL